MDQQTGTIAQLFEACGYLYTDLKENEKVDVSEAGIEILSYNIKNKRYKYKQVLSLVRKKDSPYWYLFYKSKQPVNISIKNKNRLLSNGQTAILIATAEHKVYNPMTKKYISLIDIDFKEGPHYIQKDTGEILKVGSRPHPDGGLKPVLDIEVADNACYFSDGILSHNTTSGGNALKFYASQRLDIRRIQSITEGEDSTGIRTRIKVVKNKVGPPFRKVEFNIIFGKGIDWAADLLELGVNLSLIDKSGAWYSYKGERLGQGVTNVAKIIENNNNLAIELRERILNFKVESEKRKEDEILIST